MHFLVHQFIWVHKHHKSSSMYSKSVVDVHSVLLHQFDLCTHRLENAKNSWKKTTLPLRVMQCPCAPFSLGAQAPKQVSLKMLRTGCPFRPCASTLTCASKCWKMQRFLVKDKYLFKSDALSLCTNLFGCTSNKSSFIWRHQVDVRSILVHRLWLVHPNAGRCKDFL